MSGKRRLRSARQKPAGEDATQLAAQGLEILDWYREYGDQGLRADIARILAMPEGDRVELLAWMILSLGMLHCESQPPS